MEDEMFKLTNQVHFYICILTNCLRTLFLLTTAFVFLGNKFWFKRMIWAKNLNYRTRLFSLGTFLVAGLTFFRWETLVTKFMTYLKKFVESFSYICSKLCFNRGLEFSKQDLIFDRHCLCSDLYNIWALFQRLNIFFKKFFPSSVMTLRFYYFTSCFLTPVIEKATCLRIP